VLGVSEKPKKLPQFRKEILAALKGLVSKGFMLPLYSQPDFMAFLTEGAAGDYFVNLYVREEYSDAWHWVPVPIGILRSILRSADMIIKAGDKSKERKEDGEHE